LWWLGEIWLGARCDYKRFYAALGGGEDEAQLVAKLLEEAGGVARFGI
jgi:hypothetical protein